MSLGRLLYEFQPLFRALDEPLRSPQYREQASGEVSRRTPFGDSFFNQVTTVRPAIDLHEEGNTYRVEAELPGVPKEKINVSVGEGGHSLTIEGSVSIRKTETPAAEQPAEKDPAPSQEGQSDSQATENQVASRPQSNQLTGERTFVGNTSFTRTVWLPSPVDAKSVSAKLADGVLTVTLNKADTNAVRVNVE